MRRIGDLVDPGAVALGVVQRADVRLARGVVVDAVVREVEAAVAVHHEIVRRPQRSAVALGVQIGDRSILPDPLDPAADVPVGVERAGQQQTTEIDEREATTVVAEVERAIGTDRQAVRAARDLGDRLGRAAGVTRVMRSPAISTSDDRAVRHVHRTLGKLQA